MNCIITEIAPTSVEAMDLFKLLDEHNLSHCPPEICNLIQPEEMALIDSILIGAIVENKLVSIGGLKFYEDYAKVTRMYTRKVFRGKGLSRKVMDKLTTIALEKDYACLKLETSEAFKSAVILYRKLGFKQCEPFGEYVDKPYNTYMKKELLRIKHECPIR